MKKNLRDTEIRFISGLLDRMKGDTKSRTAAVRPVKKAKTGKRAELPVIRIILLIIILGILLFLISKIILLLREMT